MATRPIDCMERSAWRWGSAVIARQPSFGAALHADSPAWPEALDLLIRAVTPAVKERQISSSRGLTVSDQPLVVQAPSRSISSCISYAQSMGSEVTIRAADGIPLVGIDYGGRGPTALLLHGLGEHLLALETLAAALSPHVRVVAMDLRWSGQSGSSSRFDWKLLVNDAESTLNSLGAPTAYVFGHSLGGIVATYYGAAHPDCAGIVNIDGWGFGDPALYDGMSLDAAAGTIDALRAKVDPLGSFPRAGDVTWAEGAQTVLRQALLRRGVADEDLDRWLDRMVVSVGDGRWQIRPDPVLYDSMRTDAGVFELLGELECPALVLTSDASSALDKVTGARRRGVAKRLGTIQQLRPNLSVRTIPGSQHESLIREQADQVVLAITDWLVQA